MERVILNIKKSLFSFNSRLPRQERIKDTYKIKIQLYTRKGENSKLFLEGSRDTLCFLKD